MKIKTIEPTIPGTFDEQPEFRLTLGDGKVIYVPRKLMLNPTEFDHDHMREYGACEDVRDITFGVSENAAVGEWTRHLRKLFHENKQAYGEVINPSTFAPELEDVITEIDIVMESTVETIGNGYRAKGEVLATIRTKPGVKENEVRNAIRNNLYDGTKMNVRYFKQDGTKIASPSEAAKSKPKREPANV